jgi:MerR family transcriptional regulator, light-induced transcriptional regulator
MVYIRNKKVKGIDYAYLAQRVWDPKRNMSRQQTIKYLGKASQITIEDIPEEYRNEENQYHLHNLQRIMLKSSDKIE